jgi:hypothetical protein
LQGYGGEVHEGKYEAMSMPDQVTGKCSLCHMLPVSQTSSQTCRGTLNKAAQEIYEVLGYGPIKAPSNEKFSLATDQILRRERLLSNNCLHGLNILSNGVVGIKLKENSKQSAPL